MGRVADRRFQLNNNLLQYEDGTRLQYDSTRLQLNVFVMDNRGAVSRAGV